MWYDWLSTSLITTNQFIGLLIQFLRVRFPLITIDTRELMCEVSRLRKLQLQVTNIWRKAGIRAQTGKWLGEWASRVVRAHGSTAEHLPETEVRTGAQHSRWHEGEKHLSVKQPLHLLDCRYWIASVLSAGRGEVKLGKHMCRTGWESVSWECWAILNSVFGVRPLTSLEGSCNSRSPVSWDHWP